MIRRPPRSTRTYTLFPYTTLFRSLLPHVLDQSPQATDRGGLWLIAFAWLIATLALAGPSWQKLPAPVIKNQDALVILLDMSLSMGAQDLKPDHSTRAIQKVTDIIRARKDGLTALLTYSGEAHTVTPLTDDTDTIKNLLPAISPHIMPKPGSRPDKAIKLAQQLVTDAGVSKAQLLLITDGIIDKDVQRIKNTLDRQRFQLRVITVGSKEGAPIAMPNSGFLRDGQGNIVVPRLDLEPVRQLATELAVQWQPIRYDDNDWQQLLNQKSNADNSENENQANEKVFDQWNDQGYWLIFLLLPVALIMFRRGVLFSWLLLPVIISGSLLPSVAEADDTSTSNESSSSFWNNLWQTPDQRAATLLDQDPAAAAQQFEDKNWKGIANYNAGNYATAAEQFAKDNSASGHYNRGNALAQDNKLVQAIEAYEAALKQRPDFPDALENKKIVEQVQKQQQEQQSQNQQSQGQQGQNSDQDGSQQDSQQQDGQQSNDQSQQSQQGQQNNSEQQGSEQQQQSAQQNDSQSQDSQQQGSEQKSAQQQDSDQKSGQASSAQQQEDKEFAEEKAQQLAQQQKQEQQQENATEAGNTVAQQDNAAESDKAEQQTQAIHQQTQPGSTLNREEQAAMQQWLNRIPDNPGNLLQRKFLYQYRKNTDQQEEQEDVLW